MVSSNAPIFAAAAPPALIRRVQRALAQARPELTPHAARDAHLRDHLYVSPHHTVPPESAFTLLRWGGQIIAAASDHAALVALVRPFEALRGLVIETAPSLLRARRFGLPFFSRPLHYAVLRKTRLLLPGELTDRFTYHVELVSHAKFGADYVVMKQVPAAERVVARLREKFKDMPLETLEKRAQKFTQSIFPLFLTREAAMLQTLQRRLPPAFRTRVPRLLGIERDSRGLVRTLYMTWLRNARPSTGILSQLDFAEQSAELLEVLHDQAGVIHLDLRLDNYAITREGVCFIDFGSAVRADETFDRQPLLSGLYEEMMRTSQIQRMLTKMHDSGQITSPDILKGQHRVDKAVDFFYLAMQINAPHKNPEFIDLVHFDQESEEARRLQALTAEILRPADPSHATFGGARDILAGIREIRTALA